VEGEIHVAEEFFNDVDVEVGVLALLRFVSFVCLRKDKDVAGLLSLRRRVEDGD